jgi:hypothetical protein
MKELSTQTSCQIHGGFAPMQPDPPLFNDYGTNIEWLVLQLLKALCPPHPNAAM